VTKLLSSRDKRLRIRLSGPAGDGLVRERVSAAEIRHRRERPLIRRTHDRPFTLRLLVGKALTGARSMPVIALSFVLGIHPGS
jgi:hypothetical protein